MRFLGYIYIACVNLVDIQVDNNVENKHAPVPDTEQYDDCLPEVVPDTKAFHYL